MQDTLDPLTTTIRMLENDENLFSGNKGLVIIFTIIVFVLIIIAAIALTFCGGKKPQTTGRDPWN